MGQGNITDGDVAELVRRTADAACAYIRGDIHRYLTLIKHGETYTLMPPYGGAPRPGFYAHDALETTPKRVRRGAADPAHAETYPPGVRAVLRSFERPHGSGRA